MTDNRTMAEMLRAPTEGCAKEIVAPPILAEQFKLKHSLINMMTSKQFFGLEKDNPHDHQKFDESFHEAWERYKDLLRACPHHGFTELHQLDTFYNALNPADQDSLNAAAGGNLLEKSPQDALTVIENKSKCLAVGGNTFLEYRDNIQGYVSAATGNFNQGNPSYRPQGVANQMRPPEKIKRMNDVSLKAMQNQIDMVKNKLKNEMKTSIQTSLSNQTNEIKNMMASLLQMNTASTLRSGTLPGNTIANPKGELKAITTRSGLVTKGHTVPNPPKSVNPEEDECVEETYTDPDHAENNIKVPPPPPVQKPKPPIQRNFVLHTRDSLPPHISTNRLKFFSTLTLFEDSDVLLEETDAFLAIDDEPISLEIDDSYYDSKGEILLFEEFLNDDPSSPPLLPQELKVVKPNNEKSSIDEPPVVELKDLPPHLEYAFLEGDDKLPVIIAKDLKDEEKTALIKVLKSHKQALAWPLSDIKENELIPTQLIMGWRVCIDYRKLNDAIRKDHFPLPFMDQMLKRLAGNEYYCFLDGFSGYFQITIDPQDQEKTTIMCPYGTFAYRRMPFGLFNAPGTFQMCMMAIFHDMIKKTMDIFMDDFLVFGNSFRTCLSHLDKMLKRYEDTKLYLNWEKSHFMVKEGIVLGHNVTPPF
nr:reverse transcriptase domain-containing protein [Tanacetum cinerariifolium]